MGRSPQVSLLGASKEATSLLSSPASYEPSHQGNIHKTLQKIVFQEFSPLTKIVGTMEEG